MTERLRFCQIRANREFPVHAAVFRDFAELESGAMPNRLRTLLLLIALLWQSVGMASPFAVAQRSSQISHMLVHSQEVDHHHHDDRSLHLEASGSVDSHQHADEGMTPAGLLPSVVLHAPPLLPVSPAAPVVQRYSPPSLEGLLRPPSALA